MTLDECRAAIGTGVVYRAHEGAPAEDGVITSVNDRWAFVRFTGAPGSKACNPVDLRPLMDRGRR